MNFVLKEHPLKLRVITLSSLPYKPDKGMATWVYGDEIGKERLDSDGNEVDTQDQIRKKRRQGIGAAQLELWRATIEVVKGNDE